ncbi:MAG: HPr family phosphocarrier protein [Planctomycetes bacterium]|nr:HPr family phosphocarrier protein [Planctomycetota bacterium]MBI3845063.1 HPr family phosphocarrier protein [Planctomycetota bacterium]
MNIERKVRLVNRHGLHARPAAEFVKLANQFQADIQISKDGQAINGKSIIEILLLAAEHGTELVLRANGQDAERALETLEALIRNRFGEEE